MKKIVFDSGLEEVVIGGGILRFNPADPNLFVRFSQAADKLRKVEQDMVEKAGKLAGDGIEAMKLLQDADRQIKAVLSWVFGCGNDFNAILQGVNLLAIASNGQRVVTNLFAALEPMLVAGAKACGESRTAEAVAKAQSRREAQ